MEADEIALRPCNPEEEGLAIKMEPSLPNLGRLSIDEKTNKDEEYQHIGRAGVSGIVNQDQTHSDANQIFPTSKQSESSRNNNNLPLPN